MDIIYTTSTHSFQHNNRTTAQPEQLPAKTKWRLASVCYGYLQPGCGRLPSAKEALRGLTPLSARLRTSSASGWCRLPRCPTANRGSPLSRFYRRLVDRQQERGLQMIKERKERKSGGGAAIFYDCHVQPEVKTAFSTRGQICVCVLEKQQLVGEWRNSLFLSGSCLKRSCLLVAMASYHSKPTCFQTCLQARYRLLLMWEHLGVSLRPAVPMIGMTCTFFGGQQADAREDECDFKSIAEENGGGGGLLNYLGCERERIPKEKTALNIQQGKLGCAGWGGAQLLSSQMWLEPLFIWRQNCSDIFPASLWPDIFSWLLP